MTGPTEDVYEAALRAFLDVEGLHGNNAAFAAALDSAYAAGVAAGRAQAAADIRAHADKHAPADGNYAQKRLRMHLGIAERVAAGPLMVAEAAQAINAMFAGGEPR